MKYLLDTHIILWTLIGSNKLPPEIKDIILNTNNQIYYSTVSAWEVEIKHQKVGSFKLSGNDFCWLCDQNNVFNIPITNKHIYELNKLNKHKNIQHNDPFDKMLLCQAKAENMIFITHDKKFNAYKEENIMLV